MTDETFRIAPLYKEVKETLSYLYQNQDKLAGKSSNYLLANPHDLHRYLRNFRDESIY